MKFNEVTNILFVTDIFGNNGHLHDVQSHCHAQGVSTTLLDPYQGHPRSFANEQQAYQSFIQSCGHDGYLQSVQQSIAELNKPTLIIGFSAGASAVWRALAESANGVKAFIGFYPGQIRNYLALNPKCPVQLYFPRQEAHFDVDKAMAELQLKDNVSCVKTKFEHGFINPASAQFNLQGAELLSDLIASVLNN